MRTPPSPSPISGLDAKLLIALGCIAFYAVTPLFPPGPQPLVPPVPDTEFLERLFPAVPGWWVVARLGALFVGTVLLGSSLAPPLVEQVQPTDVRMPPPAALWIALIIAAGQVLAIPVLDGFSRWQEAFYVALLFAPAAIVWLSSSAGRIRWRLWGSDLLLIALILCWAGWRLNAVWHNPRAASLADLWLNDEYLVEPIKHGRNLLTSWIHPGIGNVYLLFTGADLFHPGRPPGVRTLQACGILWMAAAAGLVAWSVTRLVSWRAALVAATALLFAPLTLALSLGPFPWGLYYLLPALMLALVVQVYTRRSIAALLVLGAVSGVSATQGFILPIVPPAVALGAWCASRAPRLPLVAFATAALSFLAIWLPSLPAFDLDVLHENLLAYTWQWNGVEQVVLGQRSWAAAPSIPELQNAGRPQPGDIAIGAILLPFAIPRTPIRLSGDIVLEPWTAALTAIGLLLCVRFARRDRRYAVFFLAWLFVHLPVILSSKYDRASIARTFALPVVSAPIAALAFEAMAKRLTALARPLTLFLVTGVFAVTGALVFTWVNPRILGTSAMEIIVEATRNNHPQGDLAMLYAPVFRFSHEKRIASRLPEEPLPVLSYPSAFELAGPKGETLPGLLFWTPALEDTYNVSTTICRLWPDAIIFTMYARSRLSRAFAASRSNPPHWYPTPLGRERWEDRTCAALVER